MQITGFYIVRHIVIHGNSICAIVHTGELIMSTYHMVIIYLICRIHSVYTLLLVSWSIICIMRFIYFQLTGFAHSVRIPAMEGHELLGCCFPNRNIWWTDINRLFIYVSFYFKEKSKEIDQKVKFN